MRIDRYWKQAAAGLLAMMMFMTAGGGMDSFAMTDSQPFKAQGQALTAPDKIIIKDDQDHGQSSQSGQTAPVIQQIQSTNGQAGGAQAAGQGGASPDGNPGQRQPGSSGQPASDSGQGPGGWVWGSFHSKDRHILIVWRGPPYHVCKS